MLKERKTKTIICPSCNGEGKTYERVSMHDSEWETCSYCKGERAVEEVITIEHKILKSY